METGCKRLRLSNPLGRNGIEVEVDARVDLGSPYLRIPLRLFEELGLNLMGLKSIVLPDGRKEEYAYAGPVALAVGNRSGFVSAIVVGDDVVLGTMAMAELDLVVDASTGEVVPNPQSPNVATSVVKTPGPADPQGVGPG